DQRQQHDPEPDLVPLARRRRARRAAHGRPRPPRVAARGATVLSPAPRTGVDLRGYLADARRLAIDEIRRFIPDDDACGPVLYDLMLDYPLRDAKGLRPALCIAASRALGGGLEAVLPSAAILELYHNAFLIHDDIEDGSEQRRDRPTLHREHGAPVAINVGDGMLALALTPLLDNMRVVGLGKALRII